MTIQALKEGRFQHEERTQADGKNLLVTGEISVDQVVALLSSCNGNQYESRLHHFDHTQVVDIFKPTDRHGRWYIKSYIIDLNDIAAVFISVHRS